MDAPKRQIHPRFRTTTTTTTNNNNNGGGGGSSSRMRQQAPLFSRRRRGTASNHAEASNRNKLAVLAAIAFVTIVRVGSLFAEYGIVEDIDHDVPDSSHRLAESNAAAAAAAAAVAVPEAMEHRSARVIVNATSAAAAAAKRGKLHWCGYRIRLADYIFPEYEPAGDLPWGHRDHGDRRDTSSDVLVVGLHGPPCGFHHERHTFGGTILYVNGEPTGDVIAEEWWDAYAEDRESGGAGPYPSEVIAKIYQIGPYPPLVRPANEPSPEYSRDYNAHSLQVYHTAMEFLEFVYLSRYVDGYEGMAEADVDPWAAAAAAAKDEDGGDDRGDDEAVEPKHGVDRDPIGFDPWRQLVRGGGRKASPEHRIPAVVYVSRNCVGYRQEAAELLARTFADRATSGLADDRESSGPKSFVHYGGECAVAGGIPVPSAVLSKWNNGDRSEFRSNFETIYTRYRYCLVMENTRKDGYLTEKLLHALLGGCMPIYYGSRETAERVFREGSFVFWDADDPSPTALEELKDLLDDPDEYRRRTDPTLPLLRGTESDPRDTAATVDDVFSLLPWIGNGTLCRTLYAKMGLPFPDVRRYFYFSPPSDRGFWKAIAV